MEIDYLMLLSKNDIPFIECGVSIHQPTIKEIAFIGQENFFMGCEVLNFSKEKIEEDQDKNRLSNLTDFEVLMAIINNKENALLKKYRVHLQTVLLLLFPEFTINFLPMSIMLSKQQERHIIDKDNFDVFKNIVNRMFCLSSAMNGSSDKYNPGGPQAKALVQKFKQRQKKLAQIKNRSQKQKVEILSRYLSILSVGIGKDINVLLQYTVFQLFDEFHRFRLREDFNMYVSCKLAGARDLEEVENWMGDLHSINQNK